MSPEDLKALLAAHKGAEETLPFGPDAIVYKVMGKMFALFSPGEQPLRVNLKCDPADAIMLRAQFPAIIPGYHMNKEHWNTIILNGSLPAGVLERLIGDSYNLVVQKLTTAKKQQLND